jgi:DNA-3-methyladenine glycosylase
MIPDVLRQSAPRAAPALIGWELVANGVRGRITECEAYQGEQDRACHACKGRTPRTATLYAAPGTLYVYLCYGMHNLLNLVCDMEEVPSAVLIRSIEVLDGLDLAVERRGRRERDTRRLANGPAKVCEALALTTVHNALTLDAAEGPLRLLPPSAPRRRLRRGPRVGVAYAGPVWAAKPWRWWEDGFPIA